MSTKSSIPFIAVRSFFVGVFIVATLLSESQAASICSQVHARPSRSLGYGHETLFQKVELHRQASQALRDPLIEEARNLKVDDDFKMLSDLSPRDLPASHKAEIRRRAAKIQKVHGRKAAVKYMVENLYFKREELMPVNHPSVRAQWTVKIPVHQKTVEHIESMWSVLVRKTPAQTDSSLIPLPYPLLIPGARFQEGYYWDSYFAFPTLLRSGRENLVRGQIENFLFLIKNYGLVPNGTRDYYLSRSQPPLLSQMVRLLIENEMKKGPLSLATKRWVSHEVFPLIKKDYEQFWMNSQTRFDRRTGLNHHFDSLNTPRPERHSTDHEEGIAKTYRDVRAEAESGKDFTDAFEGETTRYAGVMLNSILYSVEKDLAWMSRLQNNLAESTRFEQAAEARKAAMTKYMWDSQTGVFRDYHLDTGKLSPIITADAFVPLHSGLATPDQAKQTTKILSRLERAGGLMSAEKDSGKQWDAPYGWAPHHYFAINGLMNYGYQAQAQVLAKKWVQSVDNIYQQVGKIIEKIDAVRGGIPEETGDKYPTQDGFLWTNGVYIWALTDVLKVELVRK